MKRVQLLPAVLFLTLAGCESSTAPLNSTSAEAAPETVHYEATKASLDQHPLPQWWKDAKFGIFISWGVYSVPAWAPINFPIVPPGISVPPGCSPYAEWYWFMSQAPVCLTWIHHLQTYGADFVYDDFIPQWKGENFDPDAWIKLFEDAGAKYFILTAKHHDGVVLWPTATTQRNTMEMGPRKDVLGELFAASHRAGDRVKPGAYFTMPEWFNAAPKPVDAFVPTNPLGDWKLTVFGNFFGPGGIYGPRNAYTQLPVPYTGQGSPRDFAEDEGRPQFKELVKNYNPWIIWCDIGVKDSYFHSSQLIADYYNDSKITNPEGVVVNDRCGEKDRTHFDFNTVEVGAGDEIVPFEAIRPMGQSFGLNTEEETAGIYSSATDLINSLVTTVAKGGNFLLNIGPRADGTITEEQTTRLQAIGAWLKINGKAIYGSTQWTQVSDGGSN